MNDELLLSLYLDGRLDGAERAAFEQRLAAEPGLRAELEALRRLDRLSEELPITEAEFDAADVRARAAVPVRRWARPIAAGIAAVLVLAVSHGAAYLVGAYQGADVARDLSIVETTEAFLQRVAQVDAGAPHEQLRSELGDLRANLQPQLIALTNEPAAEPEQRRVAQLTDALFQLEFAFEASTDPGFCGLMVSSIARGSLEDGPSVRFIPATANEYTRVAPVGNGKFRVFVVRYSDGVPHVVADEGTAAELKRRHTQFRFIGGTK